MIAQNYAELALDQHTGSVHTLRQDWPGGGPLRYDGTEQEVAT